MPGGGDHHPVVLPRTGARSADPFNGLDNFRELFSDTAVRSSMVNTGLYVLFGVTLSTVLGIAMAVTLQRHFRGRPS